MAYKKNRAGFSIACSLLLWTGMGFAEQDAAIETTENSKNQTLVTTTRVPHQGGMRAYIDPETGQLTSRPPDSRTRQALSLSEEERNAASTSHEGFYEEVVPGKGVKLDLQGRFQSNVFATVNAAGEVSVTHSNGSAGAGHPASSRTQIEQQR